MESAFKKHEEIIMAGYGTAEKLKALCLNLYNPHNPCGIGMVRNFDSKHFQIAIDLIESYKENGDGDEDFMRICEAIKNKQ